MILIRSIRFRGATVSFYGWILTLCTIVYKGFAFSGSYITMLHSNFVDCILWTLGPGPIIFPMGAVALGSICWPEIWFGPGSSGCAFSKTNLVPCVFGDACTCACKKLEWTRIGSFSAMFACSPWQLWPFETSVGPTWLCGAGSSDVHFKPNGLTTLLCRPK